MLEQLLALENIHHAAALGVIVEPVADVQRGLAEEDVPALVLQREQRALDRADGLGGDVAVLQLVFLGVVADELHHAAQILEVEQQQSPVVRDLEDDAQHAALRLVQPQQAGEQLRPHVGDRRAHGVALPGVDVKKAHRVGGVVKIVNMHRVDAAADVLGLRTGDAHPGHIALDIRNEHRHAEVTEGLRHNLERDGFAGAGGAGDQPVPRRHGRLQIHALASRREPDFTFILQIHRSGPPSVQYTTIL